MIDFYAGKAPPGSSMPVAMHLDVRPALDSVDVRPPPRNQAEKAQINNP